jgi:hypothetical protein
VDPVGLGRNMRPYSKNKECKKGGGVAQMVECLPRKCKALRSNPTSVLLMGRGGGRGERRDRQRERLQQWDLIKVRVHGGLRLTKGGFGVPSDGNSRCKIPRQKKARGRRRNFKRLMENCLGLRNKNQVSMFLPALR